MATSVCCNESSAPSARRKALLFCPACDYESPIDRGWRRSTIDGDRHLVCPRCEEILARRS